MRASPSISTVLLVAVSAAFGSRAAAQESDVADPTQAAPVTVEDPPPAPTPTTAEEASCDEDPRCRIARFRRRLEHKRREEYLQQVAKTAREMEDRIWKATPYRRRYNFSIDLYMSTNLALPAVKIGYTPIWAVRMEVYAGKYSKYQSYYSANGTSGSGTVDGAIVGSQLRFVPTTFMLAPYLSVGWNWFAGTLDFSNYGSGQYMQSVAIANAHMITLGAGLEIVLPYCHLSVGYELVHAYYVQAALENVHDDTMRSVLQNNLDHQLHGASFSIGTAF